MKIKLYEVREDEKKAIARVAEELGVEVSISSENLTPQEAEGLSGIDGVSILGRTTVDNELLDSLKRAGVGYVSTRTIGYNHMDVEYASKVGIHLCNANYPPYGVAEFTIMLMLLALRKYKPAMWRQMVNDYSLSGLQGRELRNMTVGVMGTGKIGRAVIGDLQGFGCKILAYDPYPSADLQGMAEYVDEDTLLENSDIITLHIPLMESTRHMINREAIAKMKKGVVIVNASRGELTDIEALTEGIESEQIGALAMDVFENENGIYHESRINDIIRNRRMAYIRQFPNVVLTQHMAFYTDANTDSMVECGIRGIVEMKEKGRCDGSLC